VDTSQNASLSIKSWPEKERPRERLAYLGPAALSDAELLAILLRNGVRGLDVMALARMLLKEAGDLRGLLRWDFKRLRAFKGLGPAKAAGLLAAFEFYRRALREDALDHPVIRDPDAVVRYLAGALGEQPREIFKVLFLNKANQIIDEQDLFHGTIDQASVYPREVVKAALDRHATALILAHNHPSGRLEPSPEDLALTRRLQEACRTVGVSILDHLIIARNRYLSFREQGLMPGAEALKET